MLPCSLASITCSHASRCCTQWLHWNTTEHHVTTGSADRCACAISTRLWGHPVMVSPQRWLVESHCARQCAGHAKVRQLHGTISREEHICGLEIPVHPSLTSGKMPQSRGVLIYCSMHHAH